MNASHTDNERGVYVCAICQKETNIVFYVGNEEDDPVWVCSDDAVRGYGDRTPQNLGSVNPLKATN